MSRKNATDWADFFASSDVPEGDEFVWTEGSNWGMDGFHHDQTLNKGVEAPKNLPGETPGPSPGSSDLITQDVSGLPDGVMSSEVDYHFDMETNTEALVDLDGGLQLGGFLDENSIPMPDEMRRQAAAADLSWLDPDQPQDPDRLPNGLDEKRKPWNVLPELEEAWSQNYPKSPLSLVPNKELSRAKYEEALNDKLPALPGADSNYTLGEKKAAVQRAMRRSHFGHSLEAIARELRGHLGDTPLYRVAMTQIADDHGLAGTVFVRASAFPGLKNGKWVKELKKHARTARYVITNQSRVAQKVSKVQVDSVPWGEALRYYAPRLHSTGYKLAGSDPRAILKQAFLSGPQKEEFVHSEKPVERRPEDSISLKAAMESFANHTAEVPVVAVTAEQRSLGAKRAKTQAAIQKMVRNGSLSKADAEAILGSGLSPVAMMRVASSSANKVDVATYDGFGSKAASAENKREVKSSKGITAAEKVKLSRWLRQKMSEGLAGRELDQMTRALWSKPLLKAASEHVRSVRAEHEGLSGFAYVDAAAYASPTGTKGCEEGALIHRANALKNVLAFDRCGSCVLAKALPNGRKICSMYNKSLVQEAPVQNRKAFQKKAIEMANETDQEHLASLMRDSHTSVNNFDPSEFHLQANLDIDVDDPVSTDDLSGILFDDGTLEV